MSTLEQHIGNRLRLRRQQLRLGMTTVAAQLDLNETEYGQFESGAMRVPSAKLPELAALLDVPVAYFFEGYPKNCRGV